MQVWIAEKIADVGLKHLVLISVFNSSAEAFCYHPNNMVLTI
jgi:hypothetical protein